MSQLSHDEAYLHCLGALDGEIAGRMVSIASVVGFIHPWWKPSIIILDCGVVEVLLF